MNASLIETHLLNIAEDGATSTTHPTTDTDDCGFDAYVEADWTGPTVPRPSHWAFTRTRDTEPVVWSGTRLTPPGATA
jgi:hypothetical protein